MQKNADRPDIYGKINSMVEAAGTKAPEGSKKTGWNAQARRFGAQKAVEQFVAKNISPAKRQEIGKEGIRAFATLLINVSNAVKGQPGEQASRVANDMVNDAFFKEDGICSQILDQDNVPASDVFTDMIRNAFFRQTSKLGLEFFKEQGTPVINMRRKPRSLLRG